jgi:hypothetical protein
MTAEDPREYGLTAADLRAAAERLYDADDSHPEPMDGRVSERSGTMTLDERAHLPPRLTPDELAEHLEVLAAARTHGCPVWAEYAARLWEASADPVLPPGADP